jgi:hypothetical protein
MTIRLAFRAAQRSCALNATASKSQVTQWRPTAQDLPLSHQKNPQGAGEDALYMTTYSAFDPGMTRPLPFNTSSPTNDSQREPPKDTGRCEDVPHTAFNAFEHAPLMSGLATGVEGINVDNLPSFFPPAQRKAEVQTTPSPTYNAVRKLKPTTKPWPYRLPAFLHPQDGTTFALKFASENTTSNTSAPSGAALPTTRVGILQAVLYGLPDPDKASLRPRGIKEGGLLHKVVYGVKDDEEGVVGAKLVGKRK